MTLRNAAAREARLSEVIAAVARQTLADWGAERVALLDDGSPEAILAMRLLQQGPAAVPVVRVSIPVAQLESLLQLLPPSQDPGRVATEAHRLYARLLDDVLPASPENKTSLLLGGALPPEPLLPLGDLYASEVAELAGGWSAAPEVREMAKGAGGIERLDEALRERLEERDSAGLDALPVAVRTTVEQALARGRASRLFPRIVPKIGSRTLAVDLFE
ncbi:MAG TPA: hypothetical protein VGR27_14110 [Longimicrobiaceae bacterium]|nr:hypothetical protein [Longimicrobiaceae bacterium]